MDNFSGKRLQVIAIASAIAVSVVAGAFVASPALLFKNIPQAYSQEYAALADNPTIKVSGESRTNLQPDEATLVAVIQTQPGELSEVLAEQQDRIKQVIDAIRGAIGDDADVKVGQQSLNPYYTSGTPVSKDMTFNVYASVAIHTDIDHVAGLVSRLAEEGFGFESVYIDPVYYAAAIERAEKADGGEAEPETEEGALNPIAVGVSLSTKPDVLTKAMEEYEQKYRSLVGILEELGISEDQVQQNNLSIYPVFYGPSQSIGYNAYAQVIVKTDAENIEKVTAAVQEVDSYVESTVISVSDDAIEKARKELTQKAFDNAKSRAEEIAGPLGLEVMGVKSIDAAAGPSPNPYNNEIVYRGVYVSQPYYYPPVSGEITVAVTVEFELGSKT